MCGRIADTCVITMVEWPTSAQMSLQEISECDQDGGGLLEQCMFTLSFDISLF